MSASSTSERPCGSARSALSPDRVMGCVMDYAMVAWALAYFAVSLARVIWQ